LRLGKHPVDVMLDIAVADDLRTTFYLPALNRRLELLQELVDYDWAIFGVSDGGAHTKFFTAGRYPTETLTKMVREHSMLSLEDAHWRLSALPAWCAGFHDRGVLREGAPADVVVYDYEKLAVTPMEVVHDLPGGEWRRVQRAEGYRWILINGEVTLTNGKCTEATPGKLLRHGRG
jgi:N-acyl-D-aspartate/D-glutamate deacylase